MTVEARKLGGRVVGGRPTHRDQAAHAVRPYRWVALCGVKPHRNSQGWAPGTVDRVTCKKCLEALASPASAREVCA